MEKQRRVEFGNILKQILGSLNVYFQPGPDAKMQYPALVYERDDVLTQHADNVAYHRATAYQVTLLAQDPDHEALEKLGDLPYSEYQRHFATSGLNHDVFVIYH